MVLSVAICDDDRCDADLLANLVKTSGFPVQISTFSNSEDFFSNYFIGKYDVIFMDIYLQSMSGIEVISKIRQMDEEVVIAITTSSMDHALEGYRLAVLKYVEKPVTQKEIESVLSLAFLKRKESASIEFLIRGKPTSLSLDKILYFEQKNHLVEIHMFFEAYHTELKLSDLISKLPESSFYCCHKSYIVNLQYVRSLDKDLRVFIMKNGNNVYIRRESLQHAKEAFENYLFEEIRKDGPI